MSDSSDVNMRLRAVVSDRTNLILRGNGRRRRETGHAVEGARCGREDSVGVDVHEGNNRTGRTSRITRSSLGTEETHRASNNTHGLRRGRLGHLEKTRSHDGRERERNVLRDKEIQSR